MNLFVNLNEKYLQISQNFLILVHMKLNDKDYKQFIEIYNGLLYFVGINSNMFSGDLTLQQFLDKISMQDRIKLRDDLFERPQYLEEFVETNKDNLSAEEKEIVLGYKNFVKGQFYIVKFLAKYAAFMNDDYVFGVLALGDTFDMFYHKSELPAIVKTVLLPFKGKIVYDGLMMASRVYFGSNYTSSILLNYNKLKAKYGIITELPIDNEVKNKEFTDLDRLLIMMKTKKSRDYNYHEINDLLEQNPSLYPYFVKEWGRVSSTSFKKKLKEINVKKQHYAVYNNVIVASADSKKELEAKVEKLVANKDHRDGIYYFKV